MVNCKYYDIHEMQILKQQNRKKALSLFHMLFPKKIENLDYFFNSTKIDFDACNCC